MAVNATSGDRAQRGERQNVAQRRRQREQREQRSPRGRLGRLREAFPLWYGALGGPIIWALYFLLGYALVPTSCTTGTKLGQYIVAALAFIGEIAVVALSWRSLSALEESDVENRAFGDAAGAPGPARTMSDAERLAFRSRQRRRFMAQFGLYGGVFFLLATIALTIPLIWLSPCGSRIIEGGPMI